MGWLIPLVSSVILLVGHTSHAVDLECFDHVKLNGCNNIGTDIVDSANDCLEFCKDTVGCEFFQYSPEHNYCYVIGSYSSTDFFPMILSGGRDCDPLICSQPGSKALGELLLNNTVSVSSPNDCNLECKSHLLCEWWTYDASDGSCGLIMDLQAEEPCPSCYHGQRQCDTVPPFVSDGEDYHESMEDYDVEELQDRKCEWEDD